MTRDERSTPARFLLVTTMVAAVATVAALAQAPPSPVPADEEIRRILVERVDTHRQAVGIVVGVLDPGGRRRIVSYGSTASVGTPVDGDTVFEIGSITKVFTSLLLADAVQRGEVTLTDPVQTYLPESVKVPSRGRAITLQDLAMHTSGLPRLPTNMQPKDASNPYADYTVEQMYAFVSGYTLPRDVGAQYEYSNLGAGLLGHVLARRAGLDYETLVRRRITDVLGIKSTAITLSPDMRARLAFGHGPRLEPAPNWDLPTLAGAGALRSPASDMLTFVAAASGQASTPLDKAFALMRSDRRPTTSAGLEIGLAWHILTAGDTEIVWHNGGTGGYRTWIGFEPRSRAAVVVLANASTAAGPDDIGRHLLVRSQPLLQNFPPPPAPVKERVETRVDPAVFDRYVGRYQLAPAAIITISREGPRFFAQLTGQPRLEIFAEGEQDFFLKVVDAQLTFETDAQNRATAVVLHQNGLDQRAPRIEGDPVVPQVVTVAPAVLDGYVGEYQLAPGLTMTVTRRDAQLLAQVTGQPAIEVYASGEREFFYKVVNAKLVFEVDAQGRATAVVLHQNGQTPRAVRVR
jgi:CubicO group peptidase (beta-lactamase class C family)